MDPKEKIILALDVEDFDEARKLVLEFRDHVGMFKVGKQLFTHCGPKMVEFIKENNSRVFLDLKYHDIPNTVAKASLEAAKLGVDMFNIHASGGFTMMKEALAAVEDRAKTSGAPRPVIIGVTVLTSLDDAELARIGFDIPAHELTRKLAVLARDAGLDGVVASGQDIEMIREATGPDFVIVTPGVRVGGKKDDQKRTITPKEAVLKGATYIVLGRTVTAGEDPKGLLAEISRDIGDALSH